MGKRKHKKFERKEMSKVKLKTKKTVLAKAQNITDTTFKIRKIIVREQLKSEDPNELLTRRKHNVKELLSRLQHHNVSLKKDSLAGLQELVMYQSEKIFDLHLAELIEGTTRLILDEEKIIRKEALKLFGSILTQVSLSKMVPFYKMILSYLGCGMTHIHTSIQDDSLAMLDILLVTTPSLIAFNSYKIFPNFLDMISRLKADSKPERTLTVNLGSRFTSVKWHIKVLNRLHGLLSAVAKHEENQDKHMSEELENVSNEVASLPETRTWSNNTNLFIPIYGLQYKQTCHLSNIFNVSNSSSGSASSVIHSKQLEGYAKVLMPLLMEAWLEVAPGRSNSSSNKHQESCSMLSQEASQLLKCILEIIELLFEILKSEAAELMTAYRKDFLNLFFYGFPYHCNQRHEEGVKLKRKMDDQKLSVNSGTKCVAHNLSICHLFCCFYDDQQEDVELCIRVQEYMKNSVENWKVQDKGQKVVQVLRHLLLQRSKCWTHQEMNLGMLLDSVVKCYLSTHDEDLFQLLSDLAVTPGQKYPHRYTSFQNWMESLPDLLCSNSVPANTVEMLEKFACQNNPSFYASLCSKLPDILSNLNNVIVTGAESECKGRKHICNILYWVKDWSQDAKETLEKHLQNEDWDKELTTHIADLLQLRGCIVLESSHQIPENATS